MGKQILLLGMSYRDASLHVVRNFLFFFALVIHNTEQLLLFSGSRFEGGCCD